MLTLSGWAIKISQIIFLLLTFIFITWQFIYVPIDENQSSLNVFSVQRAFRHLEKLTIEPHPTGSESNNDVKNYISLCLDKISIDYTIHQSTHLEQGRYVVAANLSNIVAYLPGTNSSKIILLVAHYDSHLHSPGGGDNGAGVAALLELARTLKNKKRIKNDIIFLFTDGEELGLLGAKSFLEECSYQKDIGIMINVEGRGNEGPSFLFELSNSKLLNFLKGPNLKLLSNTALAELSLYSSYKTDLSAFNKKGIPALGIAFIGNNSVYHNMNDKGSSVSLSSIQAHGNLLMTFIGHFGESDFKQTAPAEIIYFNIWGHNFISYSVDYNCYLITAALCLYLVTLVTVLKRKKARPIEILYGSLLVFTIVTISLLLNYFAPFFLTWMYPFYDHYNEYTFHNYPYLILVILSLSALLMVGTIRNLHKIGISEHAFSMGFATVAVIIVLMILTVNFKLTYLLIVPLIISLISNIISTAFYSKVTHSFWFQLLVAIPAISFMAPHIYLGFFGWGLSGIAIGSLLWLILLFFILPVFFVIHKRFLSYTLLFILAFGLVLFFSNNVVNENHPAQSDINYHFNSDTQSGCWFSRQKSPDDWNSQFFKAHQPCSLPESFNWRGKVYLTNRASSIDSPPPRCMIKTDTTVMGNRHLSINITSPRHAPFLEIYINNQIEFYAMFLGGEKIISTHIFYYGIPPEGITLSFVIKNKAKLTLTIIDKSIGIPDFSEFNSMPKSIIPAGSFESNLTFVEKNYSL